MLTLAIETSSPVASVALLRDDTLVAEKTIGADSPHRGGKKRHSAELIPAVQKILTKAKVHAEKIDLWAVGLGPGSFIGIRVGIAAVQGFAIATGKPVIGVASFHAFAIEHMRDKPLTVTLEAGRGDFYVARYAPGHSILETPIELLPSTSLLQHSSTPIPQAQFVAQLAREKFLRQKRGDKLLEPIYLREMKYKLAEPPVSL